MDLKRQERSRVHFNLLLVPGVNVANMASEPSIIPSVSRHGEATESREKGVTQSMSRVR